MLAILCNNWSLFLMLRYAKLLLDFVHWLRMFLLLFTYITRGRFTGDQTYLYDKWLKQKYFLPSFFRHFFSVPKNNNQVIAKIFSRSMPRIAAGFQGKTFSQKIDLFIEMLLCRENICLNNWERKKERNYLMA